MGKEKGLATDEMMGTGDEALTQKSVHRPWSAAEVEALRACYASETDKRFDEATRLLPGRSLGAIATKAWSLRLVRRRSIRRDAVLYGEDVERLRVAWSLGGVTEALKIFPDIAEYTLQNIAHGYGFRISSRRRQKAHESADPRVVRRGRAVVRAGPCDHGDREFIRRRLEHVVAALSLELGRSPEAVREAISPAMAKPRRSSRALDEACAGL